MSRHKLTCQEDPEVKLDPETYNPMRIINMRLSIAYAAQQDGPTWTEEWIQEANQELVDLIVSELREKVEEFVKKVNPFG